MRVGAVQWLRGTLTVAEQITRGPRGIHVSGPPKSRAGRRTLTIPEPLLDMLRELLEQRALTATDANALLFEAPHGGLLDYSHWRRGVWVPATRAAGLDGVDLKAAQTRLGHSDPRLTLAVYARRRLTRTARPLCFSASDS